MEANRQRTFFAHWPEPPSGKIYGETANADGQAAFESCLNKRFDGLLQAGSTGWVGNEASPWGFTLGVTYPYTPVHALVTQASNAQEAWQRLQPVERAGVLVEALESASKRFFEIGYATMHTTGQGFVMAFQSSGPHAFDRALEATAMGLLAQQTFVDSVRWTKPMGKTDVSIDKRYHIVPKGVNLVIGCSTFPVWNNVPGMFAGMVTGNSVIVKAHPGAVLPIAIVVAEIQATLADAGLDPHVVQLAVDTLENPIALELVQHPSIQLIDYTGGPAFGKRVEAEAAASGKIVFSEKAGVNCVIIESVSDLDKALDNLAFSLCLYSGQMCTAPQNIFIPSGGVMVGGSVMPAQDVVARLVERIDALVGNEKAGPGTLGTIQNSATIQRIQEARSLSASVIRESAPIMQPGFEMARTASPLVLLTDATQEEIFAREWFGPISFVVLTGSFDEAVTLVAKSVREHGALTVLVYTTNSDNVRKAEQAIVRAGAPVAFNFDSMVWVNQSAAFSDFHGTGANPAGTATFADLSFVSNRYNVVGVREQVTAGL